jgi:RNA recognition motif-containing protein
MEVFSRYGTVSHAVILATVDNASRRRGFIVMANHQEAKAAMENLSRREIKSVFHLGLRGAQDLISRARGHTIDVSWAVVQRSGGNIACTR